MGMALDIFLCNTLLLTDKVFSNDDYSKCHMLYGVGFSADIRYQASKGNIAHHREQHANCQQTRPLALVHFYGIQQQRSRCEPLLLRKKTT